MRNRLLSALVALGLFAAPLGAQAQSIGVGCAQTVSAAIALEVPLCTSTGALVVGQSTVTQYLTASAITVTASSAYTAGNEVGQLLTFTLPAGYTTGIVQGIQINVKSAQSNAYKLYLFTTQPVNTTWTDKTMPSLAAGDKGTTIGPFNVAAYDNGLGTTTNYNLAGIAMPFSSATQTLYGVLVTTAAVTYSSSSDVQVSLGILPG